MFGGGGVDSRSWFRLPFWWRWGVLGAGEGGLFDWVWSGTARSRPDSLFKGGFPPAFHHVLDVGLLLVIWDLSSRVVRFLVLASITPAFPFHVKAGAHEDAHEFHSVLWEFLLESPLARYAVGHLEFHDLVIVHDFLVFWPFFLPLCFSLLLTLLLLELEGFLFSFASSSFLRKDRESSAWKQNLIMSRLRASKSMTCWLISSQSEHLQQSLRKSWTKLSTDQKIWLQRCCWWWFYLCQWCFISL